MRVSMVTVIVALAMLLLTTADDVQAQKKSPAAAAAMSVILPGAGHFYTKEPGKGLVLAGTYVGAMGIVVAYGPWTWEEEKTDSQFSDLAEGTGTSGTTKTIWYGSAAVAGIVWLYSVIDAPRSAKKFNEGKLGLAPYLKDGATGMQLTLVTGW
jgi:TM2 domain-containing membrane protein YozV